MPNRACGRAILPKNAAPITDNIPDETQRAAMTPIDPSTGATEPTTTTPAAPSKVSEEPSLLGSAWESVTGAVSSVWDSLASTTIAAASTTAPKPTASGLVKDQVDDDDEATINTPEMQAAAVAGGVADRFVVYGDSDNGNSIGVPDPSQLSGFTYYNIAFWTSNGGPQDQVRAWANATPQARAAMKKRYNDAGIKLMISAFGATDAPQSNGYHAYEIANRLAGFVKHYSLDGVDIDYEEFERFAQGRSQVWLCNLTRDLRAQLPSPQYTITHAPVAPWFSKQVYGGNSSYSYIHDQVGDLIDFYNVQFYNQGGIYGTTDSLLYQSGGDYPQSSVFEILKYTKVPASKLMIGKPARAEDADPNGDGFMKPSQLGKTCKVAIANGWHAGCMFYEFPYMTSHRLGVVRSNSGL